MSTAAATDIENVVDQTELGAPAGAPDQDTARQPRKLAIVGAATASMAAGVALLRPPTGVFAGHNKKLAYYLTLAGIFVLGVVQVWLAMWAFKDPACRRAVVVVILYASVVPLLLVIGLGDFAILK